MKKLVVFVVLLFGCPGAKPTVDGGSADSYNELEQMRDEQHMRCATQFDNHQTLDPECSMWRPPN